MSAIINVLSALGGRRRYPMDENPSPMSERPVLTTQKPAMPGDLLDREELPTNTLRFSPPEPDPVAMPVREPLAVAKPIDAPAVQPVRETLATQPSYVELPPEREPLAAFHPNILAPNQP